MNQKSERDLSAIMDRRARREALDAKAKAEKKPAPETVTVAEFVNGVMANPNFNGADD
jgi:hypothetical protein